MARARNLKPSTFFNTKLADCEPLARLLYIALWTIADREGRLEYDVRKIKSQTLPYDDCDCLALLKQLESQGFLVIYEIENNKYIQIDNFTKHQHPHVKEVPSTIPAPDKYQTSTVLVRPLPSSLLLNPSSITDEIDFEFSNIAMQKQLTPKETNEQYIEFKNWYDARPDERVTSYKPLWANWCIRFKRREAATGGRANGKNFTSSKKEDVKPFANDINDPKVLARLKAEGVII